MAENGKQHHQGPQVREATNASQHTEAIFDVPFSDPPVSSYVLSVFRMILSFSSGQLIFSTINASLLGRKHPLG